MTERKRDSVKKFVRNIFVRNTFIHAEGERDDVDESASLERKVQSLPMENGRKVTDDSTEANVGSLSTDECGLAEADELPPLMPSQELPPLSLLNSEMFGGTAQGPRSIMFDTVHTIDDGDDSWCRPSGAAETAIIYEADSPTHSPAWISTHTMGYQPRPVVQQAAPHCMSAKELEAVAAELTAQAEQMQRQAAHARAATLAGPPGTFVVKAESNITDCSATTEAGGSSGKNNTTVVLRNCPNDLRRDDLCKILDSKGLGGLYNFVHVPMDFVRNANVGYAFVNFCDHEKALQGQQVMNGFGDWPVRSKKVCEAIWAKLQGLEEHIELFRSSPVMHKTVPENLKPIILEAGVRVAFPPPTHRIKAPRLSREIRMSTPAEEDDNCPS